MYPPVRIAIAPIQFVTHKILIEGLEPVVIMGSTGVFIFIQTGRKQTSSSRLYNVLFSVEVFGLVSRAIVPEC